MAFRTPRTPAKPAKKAPTPPTIHPAYDTPASTTPDPRDSRIFGVADYGAHKAVQYFVNGAGQKIVAPPHKCAGQVIP